MSKQRKHTVLALLAAIAVLAGWFFLTYTYAGGGFYPRNAGHLDLRNKPLTAEQYVEIQNRLPGCEIRWNVPFQGSFCSDDITELTITSLSDEELKLLLYFPNLETVCAENCTDYPQLTALAQIRPELDIRYNVIIDGQSYPRDTRKIVISAISDVEISLLQYLPELSEIDASDCTDLVQLMKLKAHHPQFDLTYFVPVSDISASNDATDLTLTGAQPKEVLEKLEYLPDIQTVTLINPVPDNESLTALPQQYPEISFHWEMDVLGIRVTTDDTEVDFSEATIESIDAVETAMACFPNLETVYLGECGIDNDTLAEYRDRVRDEYKVVWLLKLGLMPVRTDALSIMPGRPTDRYYVSDKQAELLRYCEDMVCVDLGHYNIFHCEWAAYMPKLKYLILADTPVSDISPLANLEELVFLELFLTQVTDVTPLLNLKNLEDLNLSFTRADPEPIKQMTWLKRLWWADAPITEPEMQKYLPDTELCFIRRSSTGGNWRLGQNYFDMRDILGTDYMLG